MSEDAPRKRVHFWPAEPEWADGQLCRNPQGAAERLETRGLKVRKSVHQYEAIPGKLLLH